MPLLSLLLLYNTDDKVALRPCYVLWSDILTAADRRQVSLLDLLDLLAAFDCVDHDLYCTDFRSVLTCRTLCLGGLLDSVILDQQDTASLIQRSAIQQAVTSVRSSARFRTGAAAAPSVHC